MPAVIRGAVAVVLGAMFLGVAVSAIGAAWHWALRAPRTAGRQLARAGVGFVGAALLLVGLVLSTNGIETLAGYPLGRWSGASMVVDLWLALEVLTRDFVVTAALSRRRAPWAVAALAWLVAKAAMVLTAYVVLWSWLEA